MKLNRDKRVGNVLFFVEGEKDEFALLQRIFKDVLGYRVLTKKKPSSQILVKGDNAINKVAIIKARSSSISSSQDAEFIDTVYLELMSERFPVDKAAIFFLFDRDPLSNPASQDVRKYLELLQDPYDNGNDDYTRAGMLLLSYPSIEAHLVSHFGVIPAEQFGLGKELKAKMDLWRREYHCAVSSISPDTLLQATRSFIDFYERELGEHFDIDEPTHRGLAVFDYEEEHYRTCGKYKLFSHLVQALIYLGVIVLDEDELTGAAG
ncbi:MAG: hypothetical protein R3Y56_02460 [Akkermansia sp.]